MEQFRWVDRTQPPRLQQGTIMLYISAGFDVFNIMLGGGGALVPIFLILALLKAGGAYGIANEKQLGYYAAVVGIGLTVLVDLALLVGSPFLGLIGLGISVWIASMIIHDSSRSYARTWFK